MKKIIIATICSVFSAHCIAGTNPLFLVVPNIMAPSSLIFGEQTSAVFQVTNNTQTTIRRTFNDIGLALMPPGVTPDTNAVIPGISQYCTNPFTLAPGQRCLLKVDLNSDALPKRLSSGPVVCAYQQYGVGCVQPSPTDQINVSVSHQPIPQDCNSNVANFNYELTQSLDASSDFDAAWGPARNPLSLSPANPNLTNCPISAGVAWRQQRVLAAAAYWIAQKLNYCHHHVPDWSTPVSGQGATVGGYCNPATDLMPGTVYYGQQARWNYTGQGGETANNWVNNNRMWYGVDCSDYTSFLYNFALNIPMNSQTSYQAGQQVCSNDPSSSSIPSCDEQDFLSPSQQNQSDSVSGRSFMKQYLNTNTTDGGSAGYLVCADGKIDPQSIGGYGGKDTNLCQNDGGYITSITNQGRLKPTGSVTAAQLSKVLQPGDLLFIAGGGVDPHKGSSNPDGSSSEVTHVVMWTGKQVGYGPNQINPSLIAPDDECPQSDWQPVVGEWVITDSHYQGPDYRVLTPCFYLNNLWGVRRVIT